MIHLRIHLRIAGWLVGCVVIVMLLTNLMEPGDLRPVVALLTGSAWALVALPRAKQ